MQLLNSRILRFDNFLKSKYINKQFYIETYFVNNSALYVLLSHFTLDAVSLMSRTIMYRFKVTNYVLCQCYAKVENEMMIKKID